MAGQAHELGDEAVGDAPQRRFARTEQVDGGQVAWKTAAGEGVAELPRGVGKMAERPPEGGGDLVAELEVGVVVDGVNEGRDLDTEALGYEVVEAADIAALPEVETNFLTRFALGGGLEAVVLWLDAATGLSRIAISASP
mgnify:CR=1 FL=1